MCVYVCVFQRGSLPYQKLTVLEHSPPGTVVGNVTRAVDADEGANAVVYYFIAGHETSHEPRNWVKHVFFCVYFVGGSFVFG